MPIKRRLFELYLALGSFNGVAARLNREGVKTRTGGRWGSSTSRNVIARPDGIDPKTFEEAQRATERARRYSPKGAGRLPARHLFVRGLLRCSCGAAMLPRTCVKTRRETYECSVHKKDGKDACPMPLFGRSDVEVPVLAVFERSVLGYDATREHVARQLTGRADEATTQAERAERDVAQKQAALDKFDRDYEADKISAESYERRVARVGDELAGARAEAERLREHARQTTATLGQLDAEHETLVGFAGSRRARASAPCARRWPACSTRSRSSLTATAASSSSRTCEPTSASGSATRSSAGRPTR